MWERGIYKKENNLIILLLPTCNLGLTSVKEQETIANQTQGIICVGIVHACFRAGCGGKDRHQQDVSEDEKKAIYSRLVQQQLNKEAWSSLSGRGRRKRSVVPPSPNPSTPPPPPPPTPHRLNTVILTSCLNFHIVPSCPCREYL